MTVQKTGELILVTGGAGFIGNELVRQLAAAGHRVIAVDNLANGKRENLDGIDPAAVRLVEADIRDAVRMAGLLPGVSVIYHLACLGVRHSIHSPLENHLVNATATLELLQAARDAGVRRFVYVSSSEVYGTAMRVPMTEDHPTYPMTVYGASKLAGECYTRAFHRTHGYPTVVIRPFNTFGPRSHHEGDSGEVIPKFMIRCMAGKPMVVFGDGKQTRDFTFVADTAAGILEAGFADGVIGETINLGSGGEISILDLAREVASAVGVREPAMQREISRPGDVLRLYADISRARRLLGFQPRVPFHEGLALLKEWYLASGVPVEKLLEQEVVRNWEPGKPGGKP